MPNQIIGGSPAGFGIRPPETYAPSQMGRRCERLAQGQRTVPMGADLPLTDSLAGINAGEPGLAPDGDAPTRKPLGQVKLSPRRRRRIKKDVLNRAWRLKTSFV